MEYKSVNKFLNKKNSKKNDKSLVYKFFIRLFVCIIIILGTLIFLKIDKNGKQIVYKYLYENNISMASLNRWYKNHFGDITPFEDLVKDKTKLVFNDKLSYKSTSVYKDGVKVNVDNNYLVPSLESGIVVFVGNKDDYGKTVIVEQTDGVSVWYGNIENVNVSLYDYISKGEYIGEVNKSFYMVLEKNGKYLKFDDYIK